MDNSAKVNGESAMLKQMTFQDFAKLALKKKLKNKKGLRKILIEINCSIAKELVNKKI